MATFNFKPIHVTNYLEQGKYTGTIKNVQLFDSKSYFAFDIQVESNVIFNTAFSVTNNVFNKFVVNYVDGEGNFVDDQLIGQRVVFAVEDGALDSNGNLRSRVVLIKAI